jgi:hypothetical protein
MPKRRDLWDRIWKDKHGDVVIAEMPNRWVVAWAVLVFLSMLSSSDGWQVIFWWLSVVAVAIWAYLEVTQGVNYFRRGLGIVGFLLVIAATFALDII